MIDLKDVTFIIPIGIDSNERLINFHVTYKYLLENFETNIIIYESSTLPFVEKLIKHNTKYIFEKNNNDIFHRTKYLNKMLNIVNTPITSNYDIDIILPVESYIKAKNLIMIEKKDLIYPYNGTNNFSAHDINSNGKNKLLKNIQIDYLTNFDFSKKYTYSKYGYCQFFNTEIYKKYGWENENFISYGPEDVERYERFKRFGCKIQYIDGKIVYHLDHPRGKNSNENNPYFKSNENLLNILRSMNDLQLKDYYKMADYLKQYENTNSYTLTST